MNAPSKTGAYLALLETVGLGGVGLDHALLMMDCKSRNDYDGMVHHRNFATAKPALLIGGLVIFTIFSSHLHLPSKDPLYLFPCIVLSAWLVWALHDFLWVVVGSVLDYKYILNVSTESWKEYRTFTKMAVAILMVVITVTIWHYAWYFTTSKHLREEAKYMDELADKG